MAISRNRGNRGVAGRPGNFLVSSIIRAYISFQLLDRTLGQGIAVGRNTDAGHALLNVHGAGSALAAAVSSRNGNLDRTRLLGRDQAGRRNSGHGIIAGTVGNILDIGIRGQNAHAQLAGRTNPHIRGSDIQRNGFHIHRQANLDGAGGINSFVFLRTDGNGRPAFVHAGHYAFIADGSNSRIAGLKDQTLFIRSSRHNGSENGFHIALGDNDGFLAYSNASDRLPYSHSRGSLFTAAILGRHGNGGHAGSLGSYQAVVRDSSHIGIGGFIAYAAFIRIGRQNADVQLAGSANLQLRFFRRYRNGSNQNRLANLYLAKVINRVVIIGSNGNNSVAVLYGGNVAGIANRRYAVIAALENQLLIGGVGRLHRPLQLLRTANIQSNFGGRYFHARYRYVANLANRYRTGSRLVRAIGRSSGNDSRASGYRSHNAIVVNRRNAGFAGFVLQLLRRLFRQNSGLQRISRADRHFQFTLIERNAFDLRKHLYSRAAGDIAAVRRLGSNRYLILRRLELYSRLFAARRQRSRRRGRARPLDRLIGILRRNGRSERKRIANRKRPVGGSYGNYVYFLDNLYLNRFRIRTGRNGNNRLTDRVCRDSLIITNRYNRITGNGSPGRKRRGIRHRLYSNRRSPAYLERHRRRRNSDICQRHFARIGIRVRIGIRIGTRISRAASTSASAGTSAFAGTFASAVFGARHKHNVHRILTLIPLLCQAGQAGGQRQCQGQQQ